MDNLTQGSVDSFYRLLSSHNFTLINKKIDDYKCMICERILTNAYQTFCGCNYCKKCIDEQVRSGVVFCAGDTEECKTTTLSDVAVNHRMNRQISQLIVKCPEEACCYQSPLRDIGDHLRLCATKSVECPFIDFGCDQGKMKSDKLNEHLQQESHRHSEILVDAIGNLRNELAELKRDREKYDEAIDKLVKSDREKTTTINSMRNEMELMKLEKTVLEQRVDYLGNLLNDKVDKTVLEQRVDSVEDLLAGKVNKTTLDQRVDHLGKLLDGKVTKVVADIESKLEKMKRAWSCTIKQQEMTMSNTEEKNEARFRNEIGERFNVVEKCLARKIDADFVMTMDNVAERREKGKSIYSEHFNGCVDPYKMRLRCSNDLTEFRIHLCIIRGNQDESLRWPFERNVSITITNQMRPTARKSIIKHCTIEKPSFFDELRDPFIFSWDELSDGGVLHGDFLTVQCFIRDG